ncbi:MAG: MFS transporter [Betaproteobacteria bacterium]|nr:MFS transporter [Betaproteobacteria bacterium]MBK9702845.1 MFS transporter [Betaproteobacteria bacterium]
MSTVPAATLHHDARIIGVVGVAHLLSHFFQLALPPLFPLLRAEFDTSYAVLGALVGVFYVASGITQFAAGFVVDRVGARPVLLTGIALLAFGSLLAGTVPDVHWLFPVAALMGVGNGVFHPADFAILNANVAPRRLGYAYSMHGIGGNLGYALAPLVSFALGAALGWREALWVMGGSGGVALALVFSQRAVLSSRQTEAGAHHTLRGSLALFREPSILLCFVFFCVLTIATVGLQTFLPTALNAAFDLPIAIATSAVTTYLLGGTAGIVAGGFLAARFARHDLVAGAGLGLAAVVVAAIAATAPPPGVLLPLLALVGFAVGGTGPSRDLIVRRATPAGASGRVYGFVYSGLDLGATVGPVVIGFMLDRGAARGVFLLIAALLVLAIGTVVRAQRASVPA